MSSSPFWAYNRSKVITGRGTKAETRSITISIWICVCIAARRRWGRGRGYVGGGSDVVYVLQGI